MAETRQAGTLSGADVGREVTSSEPGPFTYTGRLLTVAHDRFYVSITLARQNDELSATLLPTDLVTVRDVGA